MSDRYEHLLSALYRRTAPLGDVAEKRRFYFESDRRILDIARTLWSSWPAAAIYAAAKYGDRFCLGVASRLPDVSSTSRDVDHGTRLAFGLWLENSPDSAVETLKRYDDARSGRPEGTRTPTAAEATVLKPYFPSGCRLLDATFDVASFARALEFYGGLHAPNELVCGLAPDTAPRVLAFRAMNGDILAADVSAVLSHLHGDLL